MRDVIGEMGGVCGTLLERWEGDMRDVIGEMGWGICGTLLERWEGICGTDHLPEIGPAGLPFLDQPPPIHKGRETRTVNDLRAEKKNDYFVFNLLIVNHINQYFNICLHLIRFITYNRRFFIAKYLLDNKTCSIFVLIR